MSQRNTSTERKCRTCNGAGETTHNDTNPHGYGPDPQCDYGVRCDDCGGEGWIRFAPVDPLVALQRVRRDRYKLFPINVVRYGELRQRAVSPVMLP
jgi:hypothetical protein